MENRVELAGEKDKFGMPPGRLIHGFDADAAALWNACIFPTEGASNPTFAVFALSQRGAGRMASQWGTLAN